ncbi:hypothetical protein SLS60_002638 [Paraconiothyrium brasiliense]|uniref:Uncharacterized protein n=1 Tax=Paraconiothyrium brasiliense TaxID=300254 RepID=A0ABR3RTE7_9PLEO
MDPSRNLVLHNAKLQTILSNSQRVQRQGSSPTVPNLELESEREIDMPPPPAYHSVVDPAETLPEMMHRLYDTVEEEEEKNGETPEININATTQIRGHGNIISIAQMDSMRIANLLAILIHGGIPPNAQGQPQGQDQQGHQPNTPPTMPGVAQLLAHEKREFPKININISCGATVIGDRNIVGPGLGDIARHMQLAQQRQAQAQQQQQQQPSQAHPNSKSAQPQRPVFGYPAPSQAPLATPPMSRSSSFGSEGSAGAKRKAEEPHVEEPVKRERRL